MGNRNMLMEKTIIYGRPYGMIRLKKKKYFNYLLNELRNLDMKI